MNGRLHFLLFPCYLCVAFKLSRFGNTDKLVRMGFLQNQKLRRKSNSVECVVSRRIDKERKMQYRSAHKATVAPRRCCLTLGEADLVALSYG